MVIDIKVNTHLHLAMTYEELIAFYGTPAAAAAARGIDRQRVHGWKARERIPTDDQIEYELVSGGKLRADLPNEVRKPIEGAESNA